MKQHDPLKPRYLTVPRSMLDAYLLATEHGDAKYGAGTWLRVPPDDLLQAAERHLRLAAEDDCAADPESGLPHLYHALASIAMVIEQQRIDGEEDYAAQKQAWIDHTGRNQTTKGA